jgi:DNA polymerase-1
LDLFKDYLEDKDIKKVFHNYAFDCHVFGNHGIKVAGFACDTMVMARLENAGK